MGRHRSRSISDFIKLFMFLVRASFGDGGLERPREQAILILRGASAMRPGRPSVWDAPSRETGAARGRRISFADIGDRPGAMDYWIASTSPHPAERLGAGAEPSQSDYPHLTKGGHGGAGARHQASFRGGWEWPPASAKKWRGQWLRPFTQAGAGLSLSGGGRLEAREDTWGLCIRQRPL